MIHFKQMIVSMVFLFPTVFIMAQKSYTDKNPYDVKYNNGHVKTHHKYSKNITAKYSFQVSYPDIIIEKTPIVLLLDGISQFHYVDGVVDFLSDPFNKEIMDPSIVVGVASLNRIDDYVNQNSEKFRKLIFLEIIPFVKRTYKASGPIILIGHSAGADFLINSCMSELSEVKNISAHVLASPLFDTVTSPSLTCNTNDYSTNGSLFKCERYYNFVKENNISVVSFSSLKDNKFRRSSQELMDSIFMNYGNYYSEIFNSGDHNLLYLQSVSIGLEKTFNKFNLLDSATMQSLLELKDFSSKIQLIDSIQVQKLESSYFFLENKQLFELFDHTYNNYSKDNVIELLLWQEKAMKKYTNHGLYLNDYGFLNFIIGGIFEEKGDLESALFYTEKGWKYIQNGNTSNLQDFYDGLLELRRKLKDNG